MDQERTMEDILREIREAYEREERAAGRYREPEPCVVSERTAVPQLTATSPSLRTSTG
jgi:hypothetical protein